MPQSKEVHKEYMRNRRKGSQEVHKEGGSQDEGSQVIVGGAKPIYVNTEKAAKLLMIVNALDKETMGLDGKRVNLLSMVRYGVRGPTMESVKASLS